MPDLQKSALWTYRRLEHPSVLEVSDWHGTNSPSLAPHFHHEPQVTAVFSGSRWFEIGRWIYQVPEGCFAVIPARIPHRSVGKAGRSTVSRDVFVDTTSVEEASGCLVFGRLSSAWFDEEELNELAMRAVRLQYPQHIPAFLSPSLPGEILDAVRAGDGTIRDIARAVHLSREGFIRKFDREMGMTPHAYRIAERASLARAKLRRGEKPAFAAYDAGFADQSHLGRVFRKAFGTTPARYRQAWRA